MARDDKEGASLLATIVAVLLITCLVLLLVDGVVWAFQLLMALLQR